MEFKDLLRKARTEHGYSQARLASEVGVSQQMIAQYEKGTSTPKTLILLKLCTLLEIPLSIPEDRMTPSFMFGEHEIGTEVLKVEDLFPEKALKVLSGITEIEVNQREKELLDNYRGLNFSGKAEADKYVSDLTQIKKYTEEKGGQNEKE